MDEIVKIMTQAVALQRAGRLDEAEALYRRVLASQPTQADAWHLWGVIANQRGSFLDAAERIERALALRPEFAEAYANWGTALWGAGRFDEGVAAFQRAIGLNPSLAEAHFNLGNAFLHRERLDEAIASYRQAIALRPNDAAARHNLAFALKERGNIEQSICEYRVALASDERFIGAGSGLLYALAYCPGLDMADVYAECCRWNEHYAKALCPAGQTHANDSSPTRRLKIGYVSPDFRVHVQAHFEVPLFAAHDRQQVEVVCYSDVVRPDQVTERLRGLADGWRDVRTLADEQLAELIRQDGIDILVDLTMHMERNRLLVFARRPAPVQVTWLAYPGTTGLSAIDYRLTDAWLDPPGMFERYYSEESVRLADTFWCYDPLTTEPAVGGLPAEKNGYVTFGSLNNFCKVNEGVVRLWAGVLRAVDRSRLILLAPEGSCRQWVLEVLGEEGVGGERIEFVPRQPRARYLETYHRIDIGLDTLPYNGHTTSLDAAWMGVPVVTIVGQTVVGRAGVSQLTNLGLTELIGQSPEAFVRIATELAGDLSRLGRLRRELRGRMERSPLMDGARFARSVEGAYREMWRRWCTGRERR